jgi:hypothetical protein
MSARRGWPAIVVLLLATACSTRYRNQIHPAHGDAEFEHDLRECRGEKGAGPIGRFGRSMAHAEEMRAWSCMRERGWYRPGGV